MIVIKIMELWQKQSNGIFNVTPSKVPNYRMEGAYNIQTHLKENNLGVD